MRKLFAKIGILLIITMILGCTEGGTSSNTNPPTTTPAPVLVKKTIADETVKIEAGQYWAIAYSLPKNAEVIGEIYVEDKDIDFYVLRGAREYEAFKNGDTFYHLNEVSRENVKRLPIHFITPEAEKYYFISSNIDSLMTSKYVEMSIKASWTEYP